MADFPVIFDISTINGSNGFSIGGSQAQTRLGYSVSSAGDVNGDGYDDIIMGMSQLELTTIPTSSYIYFGHSGVYTAHMNTGGFLTGDTPFVFLTGEYRGDTLEGRLRYLGYNSLSVSSLGDINGDGLSDIIIGDGFAETSFKNVPSGEAYIVYGSKTDFSGQLRLSSGDKTKPPSGVIFLENLASPAGFSVFDKLLGEFATVGFSVSGAGDVNGDGFDDIIIGAPINVSKSDGTSTLGATVIYGSKTGFPTDFDLKSIDGTNGFKLLGSLYPANAGWSVSSAGDINGDGVDDLLVGAPGSLSFEFDNPFSPGVVPSEEGSTFVVFGSRAGFAPTVELTKLNGKNGFVINGEHYADESGYSVSSAGDINGDGYDDIIIGARFGDTAADAAKETSLERNEAGRAYVVFGKQSGFATDINPLTGGAEINLAKLNGNNGFAIQGFKDFGFLGWSVAGAGDVNGDGFDDMIVGAIGFNGSNVGGANEFVSSMPYDEPDFRSGEVYIIFGRQKSYGSVFDIGTLDGSNGFIMTGLKPGDAGGWSVDTAGDINGDGFDDILVGAPFVDTNILGQNVKNAGEVFVIFGRGPTDPVTRIGGAAHQTIRGGAASDALYGQAGNDQLFGGDSSDGLFGGTGNDVLNGGRGHDEMDGGEGRDIARFEVNRTAAVIAKSGASGFTVSSTDLGTDLLMNIERLQFNDGTLAFDQSGNAGQTYRLYQAAFARTPDQAGLKHNVGLIDGGLTLEQLSSAFLASAEFKQRYGSTVSDQQYINALYQNVLNRDADADGLAGWTSRLADESWNRTSILIGFSESPENISAVGTAIANGIWLG